MRQTVGLYKVSSASLQANSLIGLVIVIAALLFLWPALLNRYPLLYPDSAGYLQVGPPVFHSFTGTHFYQPWHIRSETYSLALYAWDLGRSTWTIPFFQGLITAYVLWLCFRTTLNGYRKRYFLASVALLSLLTTVSWFVCLIEPDLFGPILYLCIFLLVFTWEDLSRVERFLLACLASWCVTAHASHLPLGAGVAALLALLLVLRWNPMRGRLAGLSVVAAALVMAVFVQLALHHHLYGRATINGQHPPFLMARVISDGPGRWYLQQHCDQLDWVICRHVHDLPETAGELLFKEDHGIWQSASPADQQLMLQQEFPLVLRSTLAYPGVEAQRALSASWNQLILFGVNFFGDSPLYRDHLDQYAQGTFAAYSRSRQFTNTVPAVFFSRLQLWVVLGAILALLGAIPLAWKWRRPRVLGLAVILVPVIFTNAMTTGVLSVVDMRFQSRVIWLVPFLAGVIVSDLLACRRSFLAAGAGGHPAPVAPEPKTS